MFEVLQSCLQKKKYNFYKKKSFLFLWITVLIYTVGAVFVKSGAQIRELTLSMFGNSIC